MSFDQDEVARFRVAVARISKGVDRVVTVDGMTRTQLSVLSSLARLGPLGSGELARLEGLNPTMLSRVVGKLEARGLATRSPDPLDGRVVRLAATAQGRALHRRLRKDRTTLFTARLRDIGPERAEQLRAALPALEALAASMSAEANPSRTPDPTTAPSPTTTPAPTTTSGAEVAATR